MLFKIEMFINNLDISKIAVTPQIPDVMYRIGWLKNP